MSNDVEPTYLDDPTSPSVRPLVINGVAYTLHCRVCLSYFASAQLQVLVNTNSAIGVTLCRIQCRITVRSNISGRDYSLLGLEVFSK